MADINLAGRILDNIEDILSFQCRVDGRLDAQAVREILGSRRGGGKQKDQYDKGSFDDLSGQLAQGKVLERKGSAHAVVQFYMEGNINSHAVQAHLGEQAHDPDD